MNDKMILSEDELEDVQGGMFRWSRAKMTMTYTHNDGTVTCYPILSDDAWTAYSRSSILHAQQENYNREDRILEILQQEGLVGQEIK